MKFDEIDQMSARERLLLWFGGYKPALLRKEPQEDRESVAKVGEAVMFATGIATINWGIAGWTYSIGHQAPVRIAAAVLAAALGAIMVMVFDRGFLYFADTVNAGKPIKLMVYGACRVIIVVGVGSITSQAVMPLMLGSEMEAQSLHMVEAAEKARLADLTARHDVDAQVAAVNAAAEEIKVRQRAADRLPADIQSRLASARSCWSSYSTRKSVLLRSGRPEEEVRQSLSSAASRCTRKTAAANAERDAYLVQTRAQLNRALADKQTKADNLADTHAVIDAAVDRARAIETESYTQRSSTVLLNLLTSDPGAFAKWAIFSFLMLVCELLPLIQKMQAGQSLIGLRRASSRVIREREERQRMDQSEHDFDISVAVSAASRQATQDAMGNPSVRAAFTEVFAANIAAYAPTEAVRAMMRDLEARHVDVRGFMHRYPQYAAIISSAWSEAVRQTADLLSRGMRAGSVHEAGGNT